MALTTTQVSQLYVALFGRASEGEGNKNWVNHNKNMIDTAALMLDTDAAKKYFGEAGETNYGFVEVIYKNTLGFDNAAHIAAWAANLDNGMSKAELVTRLLEEALSSKYAGGAPQNQLINRIDVSDYMANNVETVAAENVASTQFQSLVHPNGKLVVTDDKSTVSSAKSAIDEMSGGTVIDGETFTLTTDSADYVVLTDKNDLVEAGKFLDGKTILDQGGNDTLNATLTSALLPATTIQGVEKINLDWDAIGTAAVDATNISAEKDKETTITLTSSKTGFLGNAGVTNTGTNNVTAGKGIVGTLTIADVTDSTINAGDAKTVIVNGTAATTNKVVINAGEKTTTITVGGTAEVENVTAKIVADTTITVTDSVGNVSSTTLDIADGKKATLNKIGKDLTVKGTGDVTVVSTTTITGETVVNEKTSGTLTIETAQTGSADITKIDADLVKFTGILSGAVTAKNGANVELAAATTTLADMTGSAATNETINLKASGAAITGLTIAASLENLALTAAAEEVKGTDLTITNLTLNSNNLVINGKNDVVISDIKDNGSVDASALDGDFKVTTVTSTVADLSVVGAKGKNDINLGTLIAAGKASVVVSGTENKVTADVGTMGDTDGYLVIDAASGTNTIALAGDTSGDDVNIVLNLGSGKDTLQLATSANLTDANLTVSGLDIIEVTTGAAVAASLVSGQSYDIKGSGASQTLIVNATDTAGESIDLSQLVLTQIVGKNVNAIEINDTTAADTIIGSSVADEINTTGGADILTGGAGNDTFVFASTALKGNATSQVTITDLSAGDIIDISATTTNGTLIPNSGTVLGAKVALDSTVDTFAKALDAAAASTSATTNSVLTWFQWEDNTYLVTDNHNDATFTGSDSVIKIAGLVDLATSTVTAEVITIA